MIKKFNEFVNETHLQTQQNEWTSQKHNQLKYILTEMFGADGCRALMYKIDTNIYSFEEIINILRRFKEVNYSPNQMCGYLKMLLDKKIEVKEQRELLDEISSKFNKGKTLPVEIDDYTGKILTGIVWYCEQLEKYAENEDDFNDEGFEYLANQAYEEGYTDDDGVEYAENNWDALEIYEVDLDKEFNWTDNGRWSELFDEFVNEGFVNENFPKNNNIEKIGDGEKTYNVELYKEFDEDVYESLWAWVAETMKEIRESFDVDDAELINFVKFQLESAYERLDNGDFDIDSNIKYYCR
jgi:hypothetical protein